MGMIPALMPTDISPKSIYEYLDSKVIGQEDAKRTLALLGFLHLVRNIHEHGDGKANGMSFKYANGIDNLTNLAPLHGMVTGPTGCGKTYIVTLLAEYIDLPVIKIDASALVPEGYKGVSFLEAVEGAIIELRGQYTKAQLSRAVILVDEFDKLCNRQSEFGHTIQSSLLRVLEGSSGMIQSEPGRAGSKATPMHFADMMFIFSGSFAALEQTLDDENAKIGFSAEVGADKLKGRKLNAADLEKSGMLKEIAGRINIVTSVKELTREQLLAAIQDVDDSILEEYEELFKVCGSSVYRHIDSELLNRVADRCFKDKLGARGLKAALFAELQAALESLTLTVWKEKLVHNPADDHTGVPQLFDDNYTANFIQKGDKIEWDDVEDEDK